MVEGSMPDTGCTEAASPPRTVSMTRLVVSSIFFMTSCLFRHRLPCLEKRRRRRQLGHVEGALEPEGVERLLRPVDVRPPCAEPDELFLLVPHRVVDVDGAPAA